MRNQHCNCLQFITIPPVMEYARGAEERKDDAKREFGQKNVVKERLGVIYTLW